MMNVDKYWNKAKKYGNLVGDVADDGGVGLPSWPLLSSAYLADTSQAPILQYCRISKASVSAAAECRPSKTLTTSVRCIRGFDRCTKMPGTTG